MWLKVCHSDSYLQCYDDDENNVNNEYKAFYQNSLDRLHESSFLSIRAMSSIKFVNDIFSYSFNHVNLGLPLFLVSPSTTRMSFFLTDAFTGLL